MLARFELIGIVGRVTIPNTDKATIYLSVATSEYYRKKKYTFWFNNLMAFGSLAELMTNQLSSGCTVYLAGNMKTKVKGKSTSYFLVVDTFRILKRTKDQEAARERDNAVNDLPDESNYGNYEEGVDDLPY